LIKEIIRNYPQQVSKLYIANNAYGKDIQEIISLAKSKKISFLSVPKQKILNIFNQGYSGLLLVLSQVKYFSLEEFIENIKLKSKCCVLILDEIMDPQNFGAILRTAAAFEIDGVIIQQWNQVLITETVIETSRGGVYLVPIVKVKNVYNAVKKLKEINFWIYATIPKEIKLNLSISNVELKDIKNQQYIGIVLGNEEKGIRKNIVSECDGIITIKHSKHIESLNVSVVCGIVLYELKN
ncbi:MAG: 23S rRNA (guanosine(2251)-2'-O)-methyltransferase RlmB, partial [Endomicrobiia bacterium]